MLRGGVEDPQPWYHNVTLYQYPDRNNGFSIDPVNRLCIVFHCRQREGYQHGQLSPQFTGHHRGRGGGDASRSQLEPGQEQRPLSTD